MELITGPVKRLTSGLQKYIGNALKWSVPVDQAVTLTRKNIGIFPGRAGWSFFVVVLVLWLVATNYENNLVMGLVFILISLFVVSILHTFSNFTGLTIRVLNNEPCFAGEDACFELQIERADGRACENIMLRWGKAAPVSVSLLEGQTQRLKVFIPTHQRGWFKPGRLTIESYYPLGLLRAWVSLKVGCETLVYPKPVAAGLAPPSSGMDSDDGELSNKAGNEDFAGFKNYHPGASLRQIAWKQYARGSGLNLKDYAATVDHRVWLDWDLLAGMEREARLSRLCHWAILSAQNDELYGLRLPGNEIPPDHGPLHRQRVLKALALYEWQLQGLSR